MTQLNDRPLIVTWAADNDECHADTFTPGGFARWAETNQLTGVFCDPAGFFGIDATGGLIALNHTCDVGGYDSNDYAAVVHTWTRTGTSTVYAIGVARRDGRA
jgi:hypothetical protein